jgi:hypothetical protein
LVLLVVVHGLVGFDDVELRHGFVSLFGFLHLFLDDGHSLFRLLEAEESEEDES